MPDLLHIPDAAIAAVMAEPISTYLPETLHLTQDEASDGLHTALPHLIPRGSQHCRSARSTTAARSTPRRGSRRNPVARLLGSSGLGLGSAARQREHRRTPDHHPAVRHHTEWTVLCPLGGIA